MNAMNYICGTVLLLASWVNEARYIANRSAGDHFSFFLFVVGLSLLGIGIFNMERDRKKSSSAPDPD